MDTFFIIGSTVIAQLLVAAFIYGKLTQRVSDHSESINTLTGRVDKHETRISRLEGALN